MPPKPYVGITGPSDVTETIYICEQFLEAGYNMESPHIPMLGFLVSNKTLNGKETKNRRFPKFEEIPVMLEETDGSVFNMIHYNSRETGNIDEQISMAFRYDDIYDRGLCRSLQLNIPWPDKRHIKSIKEEFPEMKIVFQVSSGMLESTSPHEISNGISDYGKCLSYVLIDPSGGKGMPFEIESSVSFYSEISRKCPHLTLGFAGGLSGNNAIPVVKELREKTGTTNFSIDAEGGLRDKITGEYGDDILNGLKVRFYLSSVSSVLK